MKPVIQRSRFNVLKAEPKHGNYSLEDLSKLQVEILDIKAKREALEKEDEILKEKYQTRCAEMITILQQCGMDSYNTPYAKMSVAKRFSVPVPKSPEAKEQFFSYLKDIGEYEGMRTVLSQSLNSWYQEKLELARERGDLNWHPPGLEEPRYSEYLSIRKG